MKSHSSFVLAILPGAGSSCEGPLILSLKKLPLATPLIRSTPDNVIKSGLRIPLLDAVFIREDGAAGVKPASIVVHSVWSRAHG